MKALRVLGFIIITLIFVLVARELSILLHEWTHSTVAWLFGLHGNPFCIHYGGWMLTHVYAVDDGHFYANLFAQGNNHVAGLVAIGGPAMNLLLTLLGIVLLASKKIRARRWWSYFLFWFTLMNLGQIYSYIPTRAFSSTGDIGFFLRGFNLSPWVLFIPVMVFLVVVLLWLLLLVLPVVLSQLGLHKCWQKRVILFLAIAVIFFWFGIAALFYYGMHDMRAISCPISVFVGAVLFAVLARNKLYS